MNIKIAPSLFAANHADLTGEIKKIEGAEYIHVDVMDGHFVLNFGIAPHIISAIRPLTGQVLDVHLMITEPVRYVDVFCDAGADIVTVHVEADTEENIHAALDKIRAKGKKSGVVVKPNTPAEAILPFVDKCDMVLVMTVEPGFGGQKFMEHMMPKVTAIRALLDEHNPACELEVDGGVDLNTAITCVKAGANVLVAGSSVYKAAVPAECIKEMRKLGQEAAQ